MFYIMLIAGISMILIGALLSIFMIVEKEFEFMTVSKAVLSLLFGIFLLVMTLPSLKYMIFKDYEVVKGACTIEVAPSRRAPDSTFRMLDTGEQFLFTYLPDLDAYGKAVPYYCEVTVSKDHMFEVGYKIFDIESRELLATSE